MSDKVLATCTGTISVSNKGEKGAIERPRNWEKISDGSLLQSGADGEKYIDIVLYGTEWYQCIKSFTKGDDILPTNTIYFTKITDYQRLATNLFLAKTAYIENLGVDNICITDEGKGEGNVLLKADKDGITCNQGNFKDVTISGTVNAVNGSIGNMTISGTIGVVKDFNGVTIDKDNIKYSRFDFGDSDSFWRGISAVCIGKNEESLVYVSGVPATPSIPLMRIQCMDLLGDKAGTAIEACGDFKINGEIIGGTKHIYPLVADSIIGTDYTISGRCYCFDTVGGDVNLFLPKSPTRGTELMILNENELACINVYVGSLSNYSDFWVNGYSSKISKFKLTPGSAVHAIFTGSYWHLW